MLAALVVLAAPLAACSSAVDMIPTSAGGLPANVPERPAVQPEFPPVNALPHRREEAPLTDDEQNRLRSELTTLRDRQSGRAEPPKTPPAPAKKEADAGKKPAKKANEPVALQPAKDQGR
jgi:hypothetical protein